MTSGNSGHNGPDKYDRQEGQENDAAPEEEVHRSTPDLVPCTVDGNVIDDEVSQADNTREIFGPDQSTCGLPTDIEMIPNNLQDLPSLEAMVGDHSLTDDPPPSPPAPTLYESYPTMKPLLVGVAQIMVGVMCAICQTVAIVLSDTQTFPHDSRNFISAGIYCGAFFMLSGFAAIVSSKFRTRNVIKATAVISLITCGLFCVYLFVMSCIGLSDNSDRYPCRFIKDPNRIYRTCPVSRPLLIVNVAMLVSSIMEFVLCVNVAIQCFKTVLGRTRDQLQCVRTPEGHLVVFNKGPDYNRRSSSQQNPYTTFFIRVKNREILFPMQTRAVLKPPPYAVDETGQAALPPPYQEQPPKYLSSYRNVDTSTEVELALNEYYCKQFTTCPQPSASLAYQSGLSMGYPADEDPPIVPVDDVMSTYL